MTDCDYAWLTGFLEGEGSIGVHTVVCSAKALKSYTPIVQIYNTDLDLLNRIQANIGGYICKTSYKANSQKPCFVIRWSGHKAREVLRKTLPYMKMERRIATTKLVLEFPQRRKDRGKGPDYVTARKQEEIKAQISALNKRGI